MKRPARRLILLLPLLVPASFVMFLSCSISMKMPGSSYAGEARLTRQHAAATQRMQTTVSHLANTIGERNTTHPKQLAQAADYIEDALRSTGREVVRQRYQVDGISCDNLELVIRGTEVPDEIVVLGAHYDTALNTPGANDNASGIAMLIELATRLQGFQSKRSLHLVAFVNEEPPYFRTKQMGSYVYAARLKQSDSNVVAMLSLETLGYYTTEANTQHYPFPFSMFYPSTGNFIAFVGNADSSELVEDVVHHFRTHAQIPSEGVAAPAYYEGIDWSDQQSFWRMGYPGLMVTDTAPNRYRHYHQPGDTPDKLNYQAMAVVSEGMLEVTKYLLSR